MAPTRVHRRAPHDSMIKWRMTAAMGSRHTGQLKPALCRPWAQRRQQQMCPVSPCTSVASIGFSMQTTHLVGVITR